MVEYELDIPMPESYKQLLLEIIETAKNKKVLSVTWRKLYGGNRNWDLSFVIADDHISREFNDDPIDGFGSIGLVDIIDDQTFVLLPIAYKWATYHKKGKFRKWLERIPGSIRDLALFISFILSLGLTILQILHIIKIIP